MDPSRNLSILVQAHIPSFDPQGKSTSTEKVLSLHTSILSLREHFPDTPIVLCGHGVITPNVVDYLVDDIIWESLAPINEYGLVIDQPAQYKFVSKGLNLIAQKYQPKYVFKCRGDGFLRNPNLITDIIYHPNYLISATQQTKVNRPYLGDLFMCSRLSTMLNMWTSPDGVLDFSCGNSNLGLNALGALGITYATWDKDFIAHNFLFSDILDTQHIDLRRCWQLIPGYRNLTPRQILEYIDGLPLGDLQKYLFGYELGWHRFDLESRLLISDDSPGDYYYAQQLTS
jgi:hypothetical protein